MNEARDPDLVGIYITDDYIDAGVGFDRDPRGPKRSVADLDLVYGSAIGPQFRTQIRMPVDGSPQFAFNQLGRWINEVAPKRRSIGIACYGPFKETKGKRKHGGHSYGRLADQTHGKLFGADLETMLLAGLGETPDSGLIVTTDIDVAAAATGYVYSMARKADADVSAVEQAIVFIKASFGIGAGFMKGSTSWQGRLHPEIGQIPVPLWQFEDRVASHGPNPRTVYPGSVEALASVLAIEHFYHPSTFDQLKRDPDLDVWKREAWYLANLAWIVTCSINPHRIVFGGRIVRVKGMMVKIQDEFTRLLAKRPKPFVYPEVQNVERYLVSLPDGEEPGMIGALCTAAMEVAPSATIEELGEWRSRK